MLEAPLALLIRTCRQDTRNLRGHLVRLAFVVGMLWLLYNGQQSSPLISAPGLRFFAAVCWLNVVCISPVGVTWFATPVTEEKEEATLGLLSMTGMSPAVLLLGKSTSRLVAAPLVLCTSQARSDVFAQLPPLSTAVAFLCFLHLTMYLSTYLPWGIIPLAVLFLLIGWLLTLVSIAGLEFERWASGSKWMQTCIISCSCFGIYDLQRALTCRLKALASRLPHSAESLPPMVRLASKRQVVRISQTSRAWRPVYYIDERLACRNPIDPSRTNMETVKPLAEDPPLKPRHARFLRPLVIVPLLILFAICFSPFLFRTFVILSVPNVGDPFDVREFGKLDVADEDNAYTWYRRAESQLVRAGKQFDYVQLDAAVHGGWSLAGGEIRRWVELNREAIETFRRGSELDEALYQPRSESRFDRELRVPQELHTFSRLAILEASRREEAGDLAGAWELQKAALRASRHCGMHGSIIERVMGAAMLAEVSARALQWSTNSRASAAELRRAASDAQDACRMTPPISEAIKIEYIAVCRALDDSKFLRQFKPGNPSRFEEAIGMEFSETWLRGAEPFFRGEPAVSRRVAQLIFTNILTHYDLPPGKRPATVGMLHLFPTDPSVPERQHAPEEIEGYYARAMYAALLIPSMHHFLTVVSRETEQEADLVVALALQAYHREHGEYPADLDALLNGYANEAALAPFGAKGNRYYYRRTEDGVSLHSAKIVAPGTPLATEVSN